MGKLSRRLQVRVLSGAPFVSGLIDSGWIKSIEQVSRLDKLVATNEYNGLAVILVVGCFNR